MGRPCVSSWSVGAARRKEIPLQLSTPVSRSSIKYVSLAFAILAGTGLVLFFSNFLPASATTQGQYFPATGHTVSGPFLTFYNQHGGVEIFGYPITDQVTENGMPVQYFQRQRFEYHKESAGTQYEVQLSRLGAMTAPSSALSLGPTAKAGSVFIRETGHTLSGAFLNYWRGHGDVRVLG